MLVYIIGICAVTGTVGTGKEKDKEPLSQVE